MKNTYVCTCKLHSLKNNFFFFIFQSLPQTPAGGAGGKASASSTGSGAGMVNGAGADHENIRDGAGIDTELVSTYIVHN